MRYVAMVVMLLSIPALISLLRSSSVNRKWAYFAIGALPMVINSLKLDVSYISWAAWPGYGKGLTVTILDTLALAIIVTHRRPVSLPPLTGFFIVYLVAVIISAAMTPVPMASLFYAFQLVRVLIVFIAVAKVAAEPQALRQIALGLVCGICYQAGFAIWQRANGVFQVSGTLGHQNLLGMMTHFVMLPLLGLMLGGMRNRWLTVGVVASLLVIALGASRGAIGFGVGGMVILLIVSQLRKPDAYKMRVLAIGVVALMVISPVIYQAITKRYAQMGQNTGDDERKAFERAATAIWHDHPMGIGANQYVVVANTQGYSERAGVIWSWTSRSANVHNTYLLVAAETGWLGLISFGALLSMAIFMGLRFAFQNRRDPRGDIVLGCTVAVITSAGHILYEWIFVTYQAQYMFAISVGIIAAMVRSRATEKRAMRRPAPISDEASIIGSTPGGMVTAQSIATR